MLKAMKFVIRQKNVDTFSQLTKITQAILKLAQNYPPNSGLVPMRALTIKHIFLRDVVNNCQQYIRFNYFIIRK